MASNSALVVSDLDFDSIRTNLREFLRSQARFKDYDFDGSNLSVLLDILSYNTYMNNFYTNMAISESFLDSAQLRDSIVSRAKELNYTPRSNRSSVAYIDIKITPNDSPSTITIPKGTAFSARIDNDVYTFSTDSSIIVTAAENYTASNTAIYEGLYITEKFEVDTSIDGQKFILNNQNIDTESLSVTIQNSVGDTTNSSFTQAYSFLGLNSSSEVFFVQASSKNRYELVFGDGVIGKALINGNVISATYRLSKAEAPNGANEFKPTASISGYPTSVIDITTVTPAYSGAERESLSSIKYNAPRYYQIQERAVTNEDYKLILMQKYPNIRAVNVYGGETVYPPQYGVVFISFDLNDYEGIPDTIKTSVASFLRTKMPISIEPYILSADYSYVDVVSDIQYNINRSTKTIGDIQTLVSNSVKQYNTDNLDDYNITFRYSKLAAAIDNSDSSIISSNLVTRLYKKISPDLNTPVNILLDFQNSLITGSLLSSAFTYSNTQAYFKDNGNGSISIISIVNGSEVVLHPTGGTINYEAGTIILNIPSEGISEFEGDGIKIYAETSMKDFFVIKNTILMIKDEDITVNVTPVRQ